MFFGAGEFTRITKFVAGDLGQDSGTIFGVGINS